MIGVDYASVDGNKVPDFVAAKNAGCRFVLVRGGYTSSGVTFRDSCLTRDRQSAKLLGLTFGAYMILGYPSKSVYSMSSPEDQVHNFVTAYGKRGLGELPPSLDVEFSRGRISTKFTAREALDWIERAYAALSDVYGTVMVYSSARVWREDLDDRESALLGQAPLWIKTPYPYQARKAPHLEAQGELGALPPPWRYPHSPGVWLRQFQGDAIGYPGFSSTIDLNVWHENQNQWLIDRVGDGHPNGLLGAVKSYQRGNGLLPDGIVGPATFAALTQ